MQNQNSPCIFKLNRNFNKVFFMIKSQEKMVADLLRDILFNGEIPPGEKLPSVLELAKRFGVSGNTIVNATAILRAEGLVNTKRGKGIFSAVGPLRGRVKTAAEKTPEKAPKVRTPELEIVSGYGSFGCWMSKRKVINLLTDDHTQWQLSVWNEMAQQFMQENPDVKLRILTGSDQWELDDIDLYIGGESSIRELDVRHNFSMGLDTLKEFTLPDYSNFTLTPENCGSSASGAVLPIGYVQPVLLTNKEFKGPKQECDCVLDFLAAADELNKGKFQYQLWAGRSLLYNIGCRLGSGDLIEELSMHQKELAKLQNYAAKGQLIWHHTMSSKASEPFNFLKAPGAKVCEASPLAQAMLPQKDVKLLDYPGKKHFSPIPVIAVVNSRTHFPEECLRLIKYLLQDECQSLRHKELYVSPLKNAPADQLEFCNQNEMERSRSIGMICWEFFYFLTGKTRDFDTFITACNNKIKYMQNIE